MFYTFPFYFVTFRSQPDISIFPPFFNFSAPYLSPFTPLHSPSFPLHPNRPLIHSFLLIPLSLILPYNLLTVMILLAAKQNTQEFGFSCFFVQNKPNRVLTLLPRAFCSDKVREYLNFYFITCTFLKITKHNVIIIFFFVFKIWVCFCLFFISI